MRFYQAVLTSSLPVDSTGRAQLLPATDFAARDGRPGPGRKWKLTDAAGLAIAAALNTVAAATPIVIDYDHQTLMVEKNGQPAPAAGWMHGGAEWLSGQGLFSPVEWTAPAKTRIDNKEYRYISPVITYTADGTVTGVAMAALCNFPAVLGMEAVVAHLSTQFTQQERTPMNPTLAALIAALGLATTATEAEALSAVGALRTELAALKGKPAVPAALTTALGLQAGADEAAALSAVASLKTADTGTLQVITQLQTEIAQLRTQVNEGGLLAVVDGAIADGKFGPAHRDWLLAQGRKDLTGLTTMLAAAPVIPGLNGQSKGDPDGGASALTAEAEKVRIASGLSVEQWTAANTKKAA